MMAYRCPVLWFTPQVEAWLERFDLTHRVEVLPSGRLRWARHAWPTSGGVDDQPALEVAVGDFLAGMLGWLVREDAEERSQRQQIRANRRAAAEQRRRAREDMEVSHA